MSEPVFGNGWKGTERARFYAHQACLDAYTASVTVKMAVQGGGTTVIEFQKEENIAALAEACSQALRRLRAVRRKRGQE